jgi:hypothetical protein
MKRTASSLTCNGVTGLIVTGIVILTIGCSANKSASLSAPEKRVHLNAESLAPPLPPPPPGPPTRHDVKRQEPEWRKHLQPLVTLTQQQRDQLNVTAYYGTWLGCGAHANCFLRMRYSRKKRITDSSQIDSLLTALNNADNYGLDHMACLSPGLGLSLSAPGYSRNMLICLHCQHLLVEGNESNPDTRMLSTTGVAALEKEFTPIFPQEFAH